MTNPIPFSPLAQELEALKKLVTEQQARLNAEIAARKLAEARVEIAERNERELKRNQQHISYRAFLAKIGAPQIKPRMFLNGYAPKADIGYDGLSYDRLRVECLKEMEKNRRYIKGIHYSENRSTRHARLNVWQACYNVVIKREKQILGDLIVQHDMTEED